MVFSFVASIQRSTQYYVDGEAFYFGVVVFIAAQSVYELLGRNVIGGDQLNDRHYGVFENKWREAC
jgi:hypothetical protein